MKALAKFFGVLLAIALLIVWYFFDNIKGYYAFKEYCEKEGGLTVYEPLEKNVGWSVNDKYQAKYISSLSGVAYTYYQDRSGAGYLVKYLGGDVNNDSSYEIKKSFSDEVRLHYVLIKKQEFVDDGKRLKLITDQIESNKKIISEYKTFYYSPYGGSLGGPDWMGCSSEKAKPENWKSIFNSLL